MPDEETPGARPPSISILFEELFRCDAKSGRNQLYFFQVKVWLMLLATDTTAKARDTFTGQTIKLNIVLTGDLFTSRLRNPVMVDFFLD